MYLKWKGSECMITWVSDSVQSHWLFMVQQSLFFCHRSFVPLKHPPSNVTEWDDKLNYLKNEIKTSRKSIHKTVSSQLREELRRESHLCLFWNFEMWRWQQDIKKNSFENFSYHLYDEKWLSWKSVSKFLHFLFLFRRGDCVDVYHWASCIRWLAFHHHIHGRRKSWTDKCRSRTQT